MLTSIVFFLPSRLYCRLQNLTESATCASQAGRRLNHCRLGISPCPERTYYEVDNSTLSVTKTL